MPAIQLQKSWEDMTSLVLLCLERVNSRSLPVKTSRGAGNMAGLDSERFIELKDEIHGNRDDIEEG
jgi:hypothetical protein